MYLGSLRLVFDSERYGILVVWIGEMVGNVSSFMPGGEVVLIESVHFMCLARTMTTILRGK